MIKTVRTVQAHSNQLISLQNNCLPYIIFLSQKSASQQRFSKSIWQQMYNCTVFLFNSRGMEAHLGLEFNGAFGTESSLNKAVF